MIRRRSFSSVSVAQIMAFIGLILVGYFVIGFTRVALISHQLRNTKAELEAEVAALQEEVATLEAQKAFVQTDEYIEQAAREEFKLSRPGDQVVVPIFPEEERVAPQETAQPQVPQPATPTPQEPWQAWWELFFGQ